MTDRQLLDNLTSQALNIRRGLLSQYLHELFRGVVTYGPLKGLALDRTQTWGDSGELGSKLIGFYEKEVLDVIFQPGRPTRRSLVNIGAGDGYYGVGLVKAGFVAHSICFEADTRSQDAIAACAARNGVTANIRVLGKAEPGFLRAEGMSEFPLADCLFIIDIEGGEFSLLDTDTLAKLRQSELIVELHGGFFPDQPDIGRNFLSRLQEIFDCTILTTQARDPSIIPELSRMSDSDRWLLCSEGRPYLMRWVHCMPRSRTS